MDVSFKLDNRYFENVIGEMKPFLTEQGFNLNSDNMFESEEKLIAVKYDDNRQMYTLSIADKSDDIDGEFRQINAWLFDDSQNQNDACSVGIDFLASIKKEFGIKTRRVTDTSMVDLPTASKSDSMDIMGFTKKMLDVFPAIKDDYKAHIAVYGNFLYLNFFGEKLVPLLINLFENGNKKQVKKFYDVLEDAYVKGDKNTVNVEVALLTAAAYNNQTVTARIREMLDENKHFLMSFNNFISAFAKNKKLVSALVK